MRDREKQKAYDREWKRKWRKANPERWKAIVARHDEKVRSSPELLEKRRAYMRDWYARNPEKTAARRERSKESLRRWQKQNYEKNREKVLARNREWAIAHPEERRATGHKRRARIRDGCSPGVTAAEWRAIVERYEGRCAYCFAARDRLTRDHVVPIALGGRDEPSNVVPACRRCNCSKGDTPLREWLWR